MFKVDFFADGTPGSWVFHIGSKPIQNKLDRLWIGFGQPQLGGLS